MVCVCVCVQASAQIIAKKIGRHLCTTCQLQSHFPELVAERQEHPASLLALKIINSRAGTLDEF